MESAKKATTVAAFDSWDYVELEMIRREDPRISMKTGVMRSRVVPETVLPWTDS